MRRILSALGMLSLLMACSAQETSPDRSAISEDTTKVSPEQVFNCASAGGITPSNIIYDSSSIQITPPEHSVYKSKGYWRIRLQPGNDHKDALVIILGKSKKALEWIHEAETASNNPTFICISLEDVEKDTYEYSVSIQGIGTIDPRVIVKD